MSGALWWNPFEHRHREPPECDCEPVRYVFTATITDAAGNVRAVRDAQFSVRPHRHHGGWGEPARKM